MPASRARSGFRGAFRHGSPGLVLMALVPAIAAAIAGGVGLTRSSLAESEAASMFAARLTFPQLGHLVSHLDLVHATYYASMHLVVLLGGGVVALRSISLVATVLAAALVAVLGRRLSGSAVSGLIAGLVFALAPTVDGFAKTARSYGILPLLVTLTVLALLHGVRPSVRYTAWLPYAGVLLVTAYLHELSLLLLPAFAVTLALLRVDRTAWRRWVISSASVVVLAAPLLYLTHRQDAAVSWITSPGFGAFVVVGRVYAGRTTLSAVVFAVGALVTLVAGLLSRTGAASPGDRRLAAVAWPVALVPPVLLIVESMVGQPLFDYRYISYYEPAVALAVGHGLAVIGRTATELAARRQSATSRVSGAGALVVGLVAVGALLTVQLPALQRLTTGRGYRGDYGAVVRQIETHAHPGDGIAYLPTSLRYLPDGYPQLRRLNDFALRRTPTQAGTFRGTSRPTRQVLARLSALRRVFVVSEPHRRLTPTEQRTRSALARGFTARQRWRIRSILVTLWVRRTA